MVKLFSVLLSVYHKENPVFLKEALDSIYGNQTLKPAEIVLVKDGPLTAELDRVIDEYINQYPSIFKIIPLSENKGLGNALEIGIQECKHELVARMDTDDIALPDRFEKQVEFMVNNPEVGLISGDIAEFVDDPNLITGVRTVPRTHKEILKYGKKRCPVNHMAVMYKKQAVIDAGSYKTFHWYEDYYLWARMLRNGCITANIDGVLVKARAGNNMLARRQGMKFFQQEIKLQQEFRKMSFISDLEYVRNIVFRAFPRLLPIPVLAILYRFLRK